MKRILGLLLCVLAASVSAAEVTGTAMISVKGSVIGVKPRTCELKIGSASDELLFAYRRNEIPNFYFLFEHAVDWLNNFNNAYPQYFEKINYGLTCSYQPENDSAITVRHQVTRGTPSSLGNGASEYFLSSAENPQAGFLIYSWADNYWLNIVAMTSSFSRIKKSKFVPNGDGTYSADIDYHVAFSAIP